MYTKEIYPIEGGYAYRILCDGCPTIVQEYHPDAAGFVVMTEEEATACAGIVLERLV